MSLLTLVQEACGRIGILKPAAIMSNTDPQIIQLLSLANKEGQQLSKRGPWIALQLQATFVTVATEIQGIVTIIAPGFRYIINETIWNRDLNRPVFGPRVPPQWQQIKAQALSGPFNQYRLQGTVIKFDPAPAAGQNCYFEYISKNWAANTSGATANVWTDDTDISLLDEEIMTDGLIWRWKHTKGLSYAEDFADYEREVADALARDGGKQILNLDAGCYDLYPGVLVPAGNW